MCASACHRIHAEVRGHLGEGQFPTISCLKFVFLSLHFFKKNKPIHVWNLLVINIKVIYYNYIEIIVMILLLLF